MTTLPTLSKRLAEASGAEKPFKNASELVRMALIHAIQDRDAYADADPGKWGKRAAAEAKAFRGYLKKRFGCVPPQDHIDDAPLVNIEDIP